MRAIVEQQQRSNVYAEIGNDRGEGNNAHESEMIERGDDNGEREGIVEITVTESQ